MPAAKGTRKQQNIARSFWFQTNLIEKDNEFLCGDLRVEKVEFGYIKVEKDIFYSIHFIYKFSLGYRSS